MNCPVDNEVLQMTERSGVEVDYCPRCRGIWLDRGELDKILERAERELSGGPGGRVPDDHRDPDHRRDPPPRRRRKNFLSEMLEFGGD